MEVSAVVSASIDSIARARAALAAVQTAGDALSASDRDELLAGLVAMQALQAQCDAVNSMLLASVDLAMLPTTEHGKPSTAAAVAGRANSNPRTTRAIQRRGLWLLGFPVIAEAFSAGSISQAHVEAIRGVDKPRTNQALTEAQEYLVQAAVDCTWHGFQQALRYWTLGADPDGEEPHEQFEKRSLNYQANGDGSISGRFHLDPLAGHAFATALERLVSRLWREDQEAGCTRTAAQRRADAFMMLISRGAANPTSNPPGALIHIVMSQARAEQALTSLARADNPRPASAGDRPPAPTLDVDDLDDRCELINGVPVHPYWAAAAMAVARFRRLVFSTSGEILEHGRATRLFPAHAKQALLVRARGRCQETGCDAPIAWLEADHFIPWNRGGATDVGNGQILCSRHNKLKHDTPPDGAPP
jgi:hypothetical protein